MKNQKGANNNAYKGSRAGYGALHKRVAAQRGKPMRCMVCGTTDPTKRYEWANMTGRYHDVLDYVRMCVSCHHKKDGHANNLPNVRKAREKKNGDQG